MSQMDISPAEVIEPTVLERIRLLLESDNAEGLAELLEPLSLSDALREILHLTPEQRDRVLSMVPAELAAELIDEAPNELAAELVERLQAETAAEIIDELDSDVQADVIGDLDEEDAEAILAEMDAEDAADVRRLAAYDDDKAGGLMIAEAFTFRESDTVSVRWPLEWRSQSVGAARTPLPGCSKSGQRIYRKTAGFPCIKRDSLK